MLRHLLALFGAIHVAFAPIVDQSRGDRVTSLLGASIFRQRLVALFSTLLFRGHAGRRNVARTRRRLALLRCAQHLCLALGDKEELEKRGARDSSLALLRVLVLRWCTVDYVLRVGPSLRPWRCRRRPVASTRRAPSTQCAVRPAGAIARATRPGRPLRIQTRGRRDRRPRIELPALTGVATTTAAAVHDVLRHDESLRAPFTGAEGSAHPA